MAMESASVTIFDYFVTQKEWVCHTLLPPPPFEVLNIIMPQNIINVEYPWYSSTKCLKVSCESSLSNRYKRMIKHSKSDRTIKNHSVK